MALRASPAAPTSVETPAAASSKPIRARAAASWGANRAISSQLYGVTASDPMTIAGAAGLLCLVALAAGYIPARRATRVNPVLALRYE